VEEKRPKTVYKSWTIAIRPIVGAEARKITKIVSLKDGGFAVLTPYHHANKGFLAKLPMPKGGGPHFRRWEEGFTFTAESRVKLSYHADGFAQFSGEDNNKIISGIDPATSNPKGLGIRSNPLSTPTSSGPVVGITVWGLDDYPTVSKVPSGTVIIEPNECYYRGCTPPEADGWVLAIHVFPNDRNPLPVRFRDNTPFMQVMSEANLPDPRMYVVEYRLIGLQGPFVLGLTLNRIVTKVDAKSGWSLTGPSEPGDVNSLRYQLLAIYPRNMQRAASNGSLDREAVGPVQRRE
jgi:hypothetical protein